MAVAVVNMGSLIIPINTSTSNALAGLDDSISISIFSPGTITSTTISIQVEPTTTGTSFVTLQSGGSDVVMETAARSIIINPITFKQIRLIGSGSEAAARTFSVVRTMPT